MQKKKNCINTLFAMCSFIHSFQETRFFSTLQGFYSGRKIVLAGWNYCICDFTRGMYMVKLLSSLTLF